MLMSTVGAAQNIVMFSPLISWKICRGSTRRRHTFVMPRAVLIQVNVHPFAWNIGRVHRYLSAGDRWWWTSVPMIFRYALRWVIITPFGRAVVPLVELMVSRSVSAISTCLKSEGCDFNADS